MSPTKRVIVAYLLLVALCAFFSSPAMADVCDVPMSCTLLDQGGNPSPYSLRVSPVDGKWPVKMADGRYNWIYELVGTTSTLNQLTGLVPVCCPELNYDILSGGQVLAPGAGDSGTSFGVGDFQDLVIRMAFSPTSTGLPGYSFITSEPPEFFDNMSMQLKSGKNLYYCRAIAGPRCPNDCPTQAYVPVNIYEEKILGEFEVRITRDRGSWCALIVQYFDPRPTLFDGTPNPNYNTWVTLDPEAASINGQTVVNCGLSDGNQRCQECLIFGESSPGCYTYSSGGRTYKIPTGCK